MKTIICVDTNKTAAVLLQFMLEADGYRVLEVSDLDQAASQVVYHGADAVLWNIERGFNGQSGDIARLTDMWQFEHIPVVAVTPHLSSDEHQSMLAAGFADCIYKPVMRNSLLNILSYHTRKRARR